MQQLFSVHEIEIVEFQQHTLRRCYTVQCFVELISQCVATQVARNTLHGVTYLATAKIVARQVARTVAESRTELYDTRSDY